MCSGIPDVIYTIPVLFIFIHSIKMNNTDVTQNI